MTTPMRKVPSFLRIMAEALTAPDTGPMPQSVTAVVDKAIELKNYDETLQYFDIKNPRLLKDVLARIIASAEMKLHLEVENHQAGSKTIERLVTNSVAIGLLLGAHLAKEKEL